MGLIGPRVDRTALMRLLLAVLAVLALAAIGGCSRPAYYALEPGAERALPVGERRPGAGHRLRTGEPQQLVLGR